MIDDDTIEEALLHQYTKAAGDLNLTLDSPGTRAILAMAASVVQSGYAVAFTRVGSTVVTLFSSQISIT